MIAAPASGQGKTTVTLGLLGAFRRRGVKAAPFKVGPDFIDPGLHRLAAGGAVSHNLDGWMLPQEENRALLLRHSVGCEIAVIEGVMGLFDGYSQPNARPAPGSTAEMALWLAAPTILVVDAHGLAQSIAALVSGFQQYEPRLRLAGVIATKVGSDGHAKLLAEALQEGCGFPLFGAILRDAELAIPERHLGLKTAEEFGRQEALFSRLAEVFAARVDLDAVMEAAGSAPALAGEPFATQEPAAEPARVTIAVARDRAFCFNYADNFDRLRRAGARLLFFSPLEQTRLAPGVDALWLGGGYPELYAAELADNSAMRREIAAFARAGGPVYAECGGFIYLCRELVTAEGRRYPMAGVFPLAVRMDSRLRALGYREVAVGKGHPFFPAGMLLRGHEFHYSQLEAAAASQAGLRLTLELRARGRSAAEGYCLGRTVGSYAHLHFGCNPQAAESFVEAVAAARHAHAARAGMGDHG